MSENDYNFFDDFLRIHEKWQSTPKPYEFPREAETVIAVNGGVAILRYKDSITGKIRDDHVPLYELKEAVL